MGYEHKAPETFEEVVDNGPEAEASEAAPKVRAPAKPPVEPADDLSDIINQWATK